VRRSALVLVAACVAACDGILGIPSHETLNPDASEVVDTAQCDPDADTDTCFQCTDQNCCSQYVACHADPRCADYYTMCLPNCTAGGTSYSDCVVQCDGQYGAGHADFAPFNACTLQHCLGPCSNGAPDACTECLYSDCTDQAVACTGDRACDTLFACLTPCIGTANADQCTAACTQGVSQATQDKLNAELTCAVTYCSTACPATPAVLPQ
jgi:hypothetical protein